MKTEYKWIHFVFYSSTGKTEVYNCHNTETGALLGQVKWYGAFRKYSFFPLPDIIFESQCLKDIASFLDQLMLQRKIESQNVKTNS